MKDGVRSGRLLLTLIACLAVLGLWLAVSSPVAFAQEIKKTDSSPSSFSCSGKTANGNLYNSNASCPTTLTFNNIFSYFVCNMEQLTSNLMGNMYCGMVTNLTPLVMGALTLAVMFFGMGFTIGVIPATAREFQKFLLKVAFIYVFATQSQYLITYGYRFLVEGAREGIATALSGMTTSNGGTPKTGADIYAQLDAFLGRTIHFATDYIGANWSSTTTTTESNPCRNAIFAVLAIMAVAFPPIFYLSLLILFKIALTFLRGVFGYVYAIVGIAFLLALSPFFLSFFLFQQTRQYFDKWLGYLISFTLQMVIVFAFLSFIINIDVKNLSASLVNIIVPVQESPEGTATRFNWRYCTLCEFEVVSRSAEGAETVIQPDDYSNFLGKGELRCKQPVTPIRALSTFAPEKGASGTNAPNSTVQNALLKFGGTALLSLLVLAYIIDGILSLIPSLAQNLASGMSSSYVPQLGGGANVRGVLVLDVPGVGQATGAGGTSGVFGSFERGFNRGFSGTSGNSVSRAMSGVSEGMRLMVTGGRTPQEQQTDPGLRGRFIGFLTGPLRDTHD